jgi:hypothetical protein
MRPEVGKMEGRRVGDGATRKHKLEDGIFHIANCKSAKWDVILEKGWPKRGSRIAKKFL